MSSEYLKSLVLSILMLAVALMAAIYKPTHLIANDHPPIQLEAAIPKQFNEWKLVETDSSQVINPQQNELLDKIYTQLLTRTYVNEKGEMIMLSIAYGENQSEETALHYPEICYPAQGFQLVNAKPAIIKTEFGSIRAKQLEMVMGQRHESITYWTLLGGQNVVGTKEVKLKRFEFALKNQIPDGLIFRVSSIGELPSNEYLIHEKFVNDLIKLLDSQTKLHIFSL